MKDPFRETALRAYRRRVHLLGGAFEFCSDSRQLLSLVDAAYGGLPRHRLSRQAPRFDVRLTLRDGAVAARREPPVPQTQGGAGLLCGVVDANTFAALEPQARRGLVAISRGMLRFPYHVRYELLEFAVFTLASRGQGLVPLHGACVGYRGRGLLLIGESGAGKSTLTLQCMRLGLELLAEDAVFVSPHDLMATGVANFLHLRADSLRLIDDRKLAQRLRRSPVIRRRSGVRKFEIDLRQSPFRIARAPMQIAGVVFVTPKRDATGALLTPVSHRTSLARLRAAQAYAAGLPNWQAFGRRLADVACFELRRGDRPLDSARALHRLLEWGGGRV